MTPYLAAGLTLVALSLVVAAAEYRDRRRRARLAAEYDAAYAQKMLQDAERTEKIAAFAALVESVAIVTTEYEAPLSQSEADEFQRLCAFRLRAEIVMVRA